MKYLLLLAAAAGILQSCKTFTPLTDESITEQMKPYLNGPSQLEPLKVSLDVDYTDERITFVRLREVTDTTGANKVQNLADEPLGIDFGNGIYLDNAGNFSIRLDKLAGVNSDFKGKTDFYSLSDGNKKELEEVVYTPQSIKVTDYNVVFLAPLEYKKDDKDFSVLNKRITFESPDKIRLTKQLDLFQLNSALWEKTSDGAKKTYNEALNKLLPIAQTRNFILSGNTVTTSDQSLKIENKGDFLKISYNITTQVSNCPSTYDFRIYRTANEVILFDVQTNEKTVIKTNPQALTWNKKIKGFLFFTSDKEAPYGFSATQEK